MFYAFSVLFLLLLFWNNFFKPWFFPLDTHITAHTPIVTDVSDDDLYQIMQNLGHILLNLLVIATAVTVITVIINQ